MRTCTRCALKKEDDEFYSITTNQCKPCHRKYVLENQKKKESHYRDYRKRYASENKEKVQQWEATWMQRWEEKNGMSYKDYLAKRQREKRKDPKYLKELAIKKKIRDARDKRIQETRKKEKIAIAKQMIKYWKNKLSKLTDKCSTQRKT